MPQGTIRRKSRRSVVTFQANPWEVMACEMWTPMAAIFFSGMRAAGERPYTGLAGDALGQHAVLGAGADEGFFQPADIFDGAKVGTFFAGKFSAQIEDRIADDLSGPVIGDVAAAIDFVDLDAAAGKVFVTG